MRIAISTFLLLISLNATAQNSFGDWRIQREEYGYLAATTNSDGEEFGRICYFENQNCYWVFTDKSKCASEGVTPAVLSSSKGAAPVTIHCAKIGSGFFNVISPHDTVSQVAFSSGKIGIALPLDNGLFKVVRFSLVGSEAATKAADEAASSESGTSTKPVTL